MYRIRVRSAAGGAAVVEIDPSCSYLEFQEKALAAASLRGPPSAYTYRGGFPPKQIDASLDEPIRFIFQSSDTVVLEPAAPTSTRAPRQTKATKKFAGVGVKLGASSSAENASNPPPSVPPGVPTQSAAKKVVAVKVVPNRKQFQGPGIALNQSSADVPPPATPPASAKRRRTTAIHLGSKADVETKLVAAVGGGSKSTTDKFLRKATKQAVAHQYDMTLANARLKAAWSNKFTIQVLARGMMRVRFLAGVRAWKEEDVDCLQPAELRTALKYVVLAGGGDKEMLKPFNMAQVSPRVFWSLARLFNGDICLGLQTLLPDEDWTFLDTRTRVLSAKALEAQATGGGRWRHDEALPTVEPAAPVSIDLTNDSPDEKADDEDNPSADKIDHRAMRNAAAQAAMARLRQAATSRDGTDHSTTQPKTTQAALDFDPKDSLEDDDQEDLVTVLCDACGKARVMRQAEAAANGVGAAEEDDQEPWTCSQLRNRAGGCSMPDDEVVSIVQNDASVAQNLDAVGVTSRTSLANADVEALFSAWRRTFPSCAISLDALDDFVQKARGQELDECMQQRILCDAPEGLMAALEAAKLATPHDLVATPTDLIVRELEAFAPQVGQALVASWQQNAKNAIDLTPWMDDWRSV